MHPSPLRSPEFIQPIRVRRPIRGSRLKSGVINSPPGACMGDVLALGSEATLHSLAKRLERIQTDNVRHIFTGLPGVLDHEAPVSTDPLCNHSPPPAPGFAVDGGGEEGGRGAKGKGMRTRCNTCNRIIGYSGSSRCDRWKLHMQQRAFNGP